MSAVIDIDSRPGSLRRGLPERRFRPELHGVRGLAILGVVLFHLFGNGRVSGGIDIFLAISGYLFTAMLLREAVASGGTIDIGKYLGRLMRRILVPAAIVIVAITAVGLAVLPVTKHAQLWAEARASLLYFENFELINSQLAYGAAGPETSPFQHYWSLSVQGQFYLIWPLVTVIAVWVARRLRVPAVRVMAIIVGIVMAASFAYALYLGGFNQDEAYLMSQTRAWELAFGGLLGLLGGSLRLPQRLRGAAGWVGIALIVSCGFVLDGAKMFPGPLALWPLLGLALVLASATPDKTGDLRFSAASFLSNRVFGWIGDIAYGLYLWHWPLLILYLEVRGREAVGLRGATLILVTSIMLALLLNRVVERPLQTWTQHRDPARARRRSRALLAMTVLILTVGGGGSTLAVSAATTQTASVFEDWDWGTYPGAMAVDADDVPEADFVPDLESLPAQRPDYYSWGCRQAGNDNPGSEQAIVCQDPQAPTNPTATVVIAGGSHAGHWHHAFRALAAEYGWELLIVDRGSCYFHISDAPEYATCMVWQDNFIEWLDSADVDLVVTPGTRMTNSASIPEYIPPGARERWEAITSSGAQMLLLRGTPRSDLNAADCLAEGTAPKDCGPRVDDVIRTSPLAEAELPEGAVTIDLSRYVCPAAFESDNERCSAVVGNVVIWWDGSHLVNNYVETLTPIIEREMRQELPWMFR